MWSSSEIWKNRVWLKKDWQLTNFRPFSTRPYNWYRCINWKDLSLSIQTKLGGNEVCASWSLLFPQLSSLPLPLSLFLQESSIHVFDSGLEVESILQWLWWCMGHPCLSSVLLRTSRLGKWEDVQYLHSGAAQVIHDLDDLSRMNIVDNLGASLFPTSLATVALLVDTVVGGVSLDWIMRLARLGPHSLTFQNTFSPISEKLAPQILSKSPQLSCNA